MPISERAQQTLVLPTQRHNKHIYALENTGVHVWKLHEGDPRLPVPISLLNQLKTYSETAIGYPGGAGLRDHVQAWRTHYAQLGIELPSEGIIPMLGASEAIHAALFIATDPGDEVLVFEPIYSGYQVVASMLDCRLIPITTLFAQNFALPLSEEWERQITPRTKALIVINPDNPTGRVLQQTQLERLGEFAARHKLLLIVDETYRNLLLDQGSNPSLLALSAYHDRTIVLDSLSKRCGVPGMRIGAFITYNPDIAEQALKYAMSRTGTGHIEQRVSVSMLASGEAVMDVNRWEVRARLATAIKALKHIPNMELQIPVGGMFIVVRLPGIDTRLFQTFLLESFRQDGQTVSILPMCDFYLSSHIGTDQIRIAAVYPPAQMEAAIVLLQEAIPQFRALTSPALH